MNPMMNNPNMMQNQFINNQNLMNPNMFPNINQNFNQLNPNMVPNMNLNMYQINQNMIPNINLNMNQINQNNLPNMNEVNLNMHPNNSEEEEIEDVLPYIYEPKMFLKFSNITTIKNGTYIKVKLPKSLTKSDLYSVAKKYQTDFYSTIKLSCNNYLLKEDDTSIEGIEEGSVIHIIEDIDFPDGSYYKELMKKNENYETIRYLFKFNGKISSIEFPKNITVSEMMKGVFSKLVLNSKSYRIDPINPLDASKKIINVFSPQKIFQVFMAQPPESHWRFGKLISARFKGENILIGTLNSINRLIERINSYIYPKKIKKLIIGNKEFFVKEIKNFSLKSIGINENFSCDVEFEEFQDEE